MIELIRQQTVIGWTLIKATFQKLRRMNYSDASQICNKGFVAWIVFPSFTGSQDRVPPMLINKYIVKYESETYEVRTNRTQNNHRWYALLDIYTLWAVYISSGNCCIKQRTVESVVVIKLCTVPVEVDSVRLAITGERVHYTFRLHEIFAC